MKVTITCHLDHAKRSKRFFFSSKVSDSICADPLESGMAAERFVQFNFDRNCHTAFLEARGDRSSGQTVTIQTERNSDNPYQHLTTDEDGSGFLDAVFTLVQWMRL